MQRRNLLRLFITVAAGSFFAALPTTLMARRGRPATPTSVGGVRRRTRRRTRRRVYRNMRLTSLPYGCSTTRIRSGVTYYYCGGIWYLPSYQGTTVVYVVEEIESGASTDVEFEEDA